VLVSELGGLFLESVPGSGASVREHTLAKLRSQSRSLTVYHGSWSCSGQRSGSMLCPVTTSTADC